MADNFSHSISPNGMQPKYAVQPDNLSSEDTLKEIARLACPTLMIENEELRDEIYTLKAINTGLTKELYECKEKLKEAQQQIKNSNTAPPSGSGFMYEYDVLDFAENASAATINYLFDGLLHLTEIKTSTDKYLIDSASALIPIYIILKDSTVIVQTLYCFCGSLEDFCKYWNYNVASRIEDKERAKLLTVNYSSIKAEINKQPRKDRKPGCWRSVFNSASKHKKPLRRAINIKAHMESAFKAS